MPETNNTPGPLEVAEYIQLTSEIIDEQIQKIASLTEEVRQGRRALEKSASETKPISENSVLRVLQKVAQARPNLLGCSPEDLAARAARDPERLLAVMDKLAGDAFDMSVPVSKLGSPIMNSEETRVARPSQKTLNIERESDLAFEKTFLG